MAESHAEQLDPSVLGEDVGDARPVDDYPPEEPLAVEDPSITEGGLIAPDDVARRETRTVPDGVASERPQAPGLLDPDRAPDLVDTEERLVADAAADGESAPEAAALQVVDDDGSRDRR